MQGTSEDSESSSSPGSATGKRRGISVILAGSAAVAIGTVVLSVRAAHEQNHVALSGSPRLVTVAPARETQYRDTRSYVGAVEPWVEADVGPQYISGFVETVNVRPGAVVHRGDVLAALDCSASNAAEAELLETNARLLRTRLDVHDCILRAPFDGEIASRTFDPGAFVHPGASIVSVVDRNTVRVTVEAPEKDFDALSPSTQVQIRMLATGTTLSAPISRRAPRADPSTRTIHFEIDVPNPARAYPVGTTATVQIEVGNPVPATAIPLYATTQQEGKAKVFVVEGNVARSLVLPVLGETGGSVFFAPDALRAGALVVTEGRAVLSDGDRVRYQLDRPPQRAGGPPNGAPVENPARGGGYGRPL